MVSIMRLSGVAMIAIGVAAEEGSADGFVSRISGVTTPSILWSNVETAYTNEEIDRITNVDEVLETFTAGITKNGTAPGYIIVYGLPSGMSTKAWLQHEPDDEAVFPTQPGSGVLFPYTLAIPGQPSDEDWAEVFASVGSPTVRFLTNIVDDPSVELLYEGVEDTWPQVRSRMGDAKVLVIQPDLLESARAELSLTANLRHFFPPHGFTGERVYVLMADTTDIPADALPTVLDDKGAISHSVRGPLFADSIDYHNLLGQAVDIADEDDEIAHSEAAVAVVYEERPAAELRRLQGDSSSTDGGDSGDVGDSMDDSTLLRITPMQVQQVMIMLTMFVTVWIVVNCTGQISTPKLYLEKPIPINKEF